MSVINGPSSITAQVPSCGNCGTAESLIFEDFVPARLASPGREAVPATAAYSCAECGGFSAHPVPASWCPPNWSLQS